MHPLLSPSPQQLLPQLFDRPTCRLWQQLTGQKRISQAHHCTSCRTCHRRPPPRCTRRALQAMCHFLHLLRQQACAIERAVGLGADIGAHAPVCLPVGVKLLYCFEKLLIVAPHCGEAIG